ncbi:uncharacterized protein SPAPADRAFT_58842 [Spathaspora passalidarum NRRL Y-27907]|uniref:Uncharacterized protein n=1 Tax=Spathaspora passalidarum (strain NRRL Y-27907 / 11-Y1) TaxID=619300 RepID=G3AE92_SPAPN|nr:uncharacterized protein SPAPADRAFT_58842 [Spathaspora passalidarum NRRL Y-27907]EGW35626.1 hypothetical protein SPAPADRAFT_58842 [Spathaspora passalidarum NRRL Y-27907]
MFFTILIVGFILVAFVLLLPYVSGLTKVEIDTHRRAKDKQNQKQKRTAAADVPVDQFGYVPPDEIESKDEEDHSLKARASALKEKLQVTSEDMPIKIHLNQGDSAGLRRRKEKLDIDTDPNKYDYDIDELIAEETETARREQEHDFYKDQDIGRDKEAMV